MFHSIRPSSGIAIVHLSLLVACGGSDGITPLPPSDDAGSGGMTGDPSGGQGGALMTPDSSSFELLFRDELDELDPARWQLMTHSWPGNLALFSSDSVTFEGGEMHLTLIDAPAGTTDGGETKPYLGAEVRSIDTITYGRVRTRARFAQGSAVVSSLVTIYTPWPADDWNELDIESLGADPSQLQFNAMVYTGPEMTPPVASSVTPTQDPLLVDVGFDVSADFHEYMIEWTPEGAYFWVDDNLVRTWTKNIDLMDLPQNVLLTIWASNSPTWAGPVTDETSGARASYDWVEVYQYVP